MAFCPTCKQAYPDDVTECPDDRTALVDELPFQAVPAETGGTWVEIASVGAVDEAQIVRGFLEEEGIPAQVENVQTSELPTTFGSLGEIRIYVPAEHEAKAMELLKRREAEYEQLDDDSETVVTDEGPADIDENAAAERE